MQINSQILEPFLQALISTLILNTEFIIRIVICNELYRMMNMMLKIGKDMRVSTMMWINRLI